MSQHPSHRVRYEGGTGITLRSHVHEPKAGLAGNLPLLGSFPVPFSGLQYVITYYISL